MRDFFGKLDTWQEFGNVFSYFLGFKMSQLNPLEDRHLLLQIESALFRSKPNIQGFLLQNFQTVCLKKFQVYQKLNSNRFFQFFEKLMIMITFILVDHDD